VNSTWKDGAAEGMETGRVAGAAKVAKAVEVHKASDKSNHPNRPDAAKAAAARYLANPSRYLLALLELLRMAE
jgi:hypothetical protein